MELAFAVDEHRDARRSVNFLGELSLSFGRLLRGRAIYERSDLAVTIQEVSFEALGIVSVVGFLIGVILGFIGAVQFQQFGAAIYTADLVGVGCQKWAEGWAMSTREHNVCRLLAPYGMESSPKSKR